MDILEIIPPKQLNFSVPTDTQRVITLSNLTLHSVFVLILNSHPYELSLSQHCFLMQAFEEKKIEVTLNWAQESCNLSVGKLRLLYQEVEEENNQQELRAAILAGQGKHYHQDLSVYVNLDTKALDFLNYRAVEKEGAILYDSVYRKDEKRYYLLKRISHLKQSLEIQKKINLNEPLKNDILSYLQELPEVVSINPCENGSFLIEFNQEKTDTCQIIEFSLSSQKIIYAFKRIVSYGQPKQMQTLVNLQEPIPQLPKQQPKESPKKESPPKKVMKKTSQQQQEAPKPTIQEPKEANHIDEEKKAAKLKQKKAQFQKSVVKQSFLGRREADKVKSRRKNKSQQKIIQHEPDSQSQEQQQNQMFREQMRQLKQMGLVQPVKKQQKEPVKQVQEPRQPQVKYKQASIQFAQRVLNVYIEEKEHITEVYVILKDCVRCFTVEDPATMKIIKFDAMYEENTHMPCPVQKYKDQLIFGNETILFWVNLSTSESQWKYVQRKYIYALSVIQELSLVAVGGKNFSKLAYFGKETSRSNIKLYSCSAADKHDHLFTYDIPGQNVGNIMNMAYINAPPHGTKLLLVHTLSGESMSTFYFFRVKAFNKIEIYGQIDLDELGILDLIKFRYNKESSRIVCMQSLGQTKVDTFKRLKLKCQYEKVQVSTEGFKFPLKQYTSFQLGGSKDSKSRQWMSLVDKKGYQVHLHDFEKAHTEEEELGKGELKHVYSVNNGKHLLLCTEGTIRIREKIIVQ